jgi:hypothetical protein
MNRHHGIEGNLLPLRNVKRAKASRKPRIESGDAVNRKATIYYTGRRRYWLMNI